MTNPISDSVNAWLEADGWDVFQEVQCPGTSGRADVVAVKAGLVRVVEVKKQLSFALVHQGLRWTEYAHEVFLAVPGAKSSSGRTMAIRTARQNGLGVLEVVSLWPVEEIHARAVLVDIEAERRDSVNPELLHSLQPELKTHALAGGNRGGHWTVFKETVRELRTFAQAHPGCTLRSALQTVPHHYRSVSSGMNALTKCNADDMHKLGIEERTEDGAPRLFVYEVEAKAEGDST